MKTNLLSARRAVLVLAVAAFVVGLRAAAPRLEPVQLELSAGTNLAAARSPDGKWIAIDLQGTIFVLPSAGGAARALTDGLGDDRQPAWSPDSARIVFQSYRSGNYHVWSVRTDGSDLKQHTDGPYDDREPTWSPDGKRLLFSSDRSGNYDVWELEIASNQLRQLTSNHGNDFQPAYAPDSARIAFVSTRSEGTGVYVREADGTERRLVDSPAPNAPAWSADGHSVSFQTTGPGVTTLSVADVTDGKVRVVSATGEDVFPFRGSWVGNDTVIYTADGLIKSRSLTAPAVETIAFRAPLEVDRPKFTPKVYDFTSTKPKPVKGIRGPAVSPDGKQVVFGALGDLWLLTIGQPKPERLTDDAFFDADPAWSPDGRQIVFVSDRRGGFDLYALDVATRQVRSLTETPEEESLPTWLPDGNHIAYISSVPSAFIGSLQILDLKTGTSKTLQTAIFQPSQPSVSPDGKFITLGAVDAYSTRYREGVNKFALVKTDGTASDTAHLSLASPFSTETTGVRHRNGPYWSPDGAHVAFIKDDLLWVIDVDASGKFTGAPRALTKEFSESPSWTGDSHSLVYLGDDRLKIVDVVTAKSKEIPLDLTWTNHPATGTTIVHAGRLFDGRNEKLQTDVDVVIEGNKITAIRPHGSKPAPAGAVLIDASQQTVLPGLFERHAHFWASSGETLGRLWLSYGITAVRQPGTDPLEALDHRESWLSGRRAGPFEFFSGPLTDGGRVYYGPAASVASEAALERQLQRAQRLDYDLIKTYVRLPDIYQKRAIEFAHQIGITVSSHEIYPAARYGVDAVEHIGATSRRGYSPKISALGRTYDDVLQIVSKSGLTITPTLSLFGGFHTLATREPEILETPQFTRLFPAIYRDSILNGIRQPRPQVSAALVSFPEFSRTVKKFADAGSSITAGTDAPIIPFGITLHVELWNYVEAGFTPFQALQTATLNAARSLHVEDQLGTLEPGKIANLIAVDGNPLVNIRDTVRVRQVLVNGRAHSIEQLLAGSIPPLASDLKSAASR